MFGAGILGTMEVIGCPIRSNVLIATHPEIRKCNMRSMGKGHSINFISEQWNWHHEIKL